jgi:RHS repeat-associated protein
MGNITALTRQGWLYNTTWGLIDDLTMTYDGNRLVKCDDAVSAQPTNNGAHHFTDLADEDEEYEYDGNGNMTKDLNREITSIEYNSLNLPRQITFSDATKMKLTYDAAGNKLRAEYWTIPTFNPGGPIGPAALGGGAEPQGGGIVGPILPPINQNDPQVVTDYCGNLIYRNDTLSMLLTEEGYVTFDERGEPLYHYYLKDHLGSVRVVLDGDGTVEQVNDYYPSGTLMYTSTNGTVQPYKFGQKELERTLPLDEYDFGARQYNPVTARWDRMDPLCEKYYGVSPYAYCHGDPVNRFDPDGCKDTVFVKGKDKPISEDKSTRTPLFNRDGSPNKGAYNCHTFAWSYPNGDPTDVVDPSHPRWDNNPENNMSDYILLNNNEPNEVDDRVVYYIDNNSDGLYQKGEHIVHSAIVWKVDKEGYTTEVISKMGQDGISRNHPRAPGFYETHNGQKTNRAYFRETKKWLLQSNRRSLSLPKYHHVEKPDALYVAPIIHH